jgi:hypothetical protein
VNKYLLIFSILILLCSVYLLHKERSHTDGIQSGIAILKDKTQEVQTRRAKSMSWDEANPGEYFEYYDSILTMKASQAQIVFNDGTDLQMEPDSLIVLEPPLQKNSSIRLNLKQGAATLTLKKGEKVETNKQILVARETATINLSIEAKNSEETAVSPSTEMNKIVSTAQIEVYDLPPVENPSEKIIGAKPSPSPLNKNPKVPSLAPPITSNKPLAPPPPEKKEVSSKLKDVLRLKVIREDE